MGAEQAPDKAPRFRELDLDQAERLLDLGIDEQSVRELLDATPDGHVLLGHLPGALAQPDRP